MRNVTRGSSFLVRAALGGALALAALAMSAPAVAAQDAPPAVEYRKTTMQSIRYHFTALRALAGGAVDYRDHAIYHARALDQLAHMAGDVFPEGSGGPSSGALPAVWEDREGFLSKLQMLRDASSNAVRATEAGDMAGLGAALRDVGGSCRACHTDYRESNNE